MLLGDLQGCDYNKVVLKGFTIASSFGKVFNKVESKNKKTGNKETLVIQSDIMMTLVCSISNSIGLTNQLFARKFT